eukprot:8030304-Pyramimonas_sp.AAC.1
MHASSTVGWRGSLWTVAESGTCTQLALNAVRSALPRGSDGSDGPTDSRGRSSAERSAAK